MVLGYADLAILVIGCGLVRCDCFSVWMVDFCVCWYNTVSC